MKSKMNLELYSLQLWQLTTLLSAVDCYVLFAANLDDFRTLAKKIVPNKLADKLADMVSDSTIRYREEEINEPEYDTTYSDESEKETDKVNEREIKEKMITKLTTIESATNKFIDKEKNNDLISLINIDELAEKVKGRLTKGLSTSDHRSMKKERLLKVVRDIFRNDKEDTKYDKESVYDEGSNKDINIANKHSNNYNIKESNRNDKIQKLHPNEHKKIKNNPIKSNRENYYEKPKDNDNANMPFDKIDFKKSSNDSYEDYQMPEKDDNVYVSEETTDTQTSKIETKYQLQTSETGERQPQNTNFKQVQKFSNKETQQRKPKDVRDNLKHKVKSDYKNREKHVKLPMDYEETYTNEPEEIKARTEQLWLDRDYPVFNRTEDRFKDIQNRETNIKVVTSDKKIYIKGDDKRKIVETRQTTRKRKIGGTGFPTREVYKIVTPNYYEKLPIVAEKYNFEEPIPEKDREPENLKSFPNFEASVNGRIKI